MKLSKVKHEHSIGIFLFFFVQELDLFICEIDSQGKESITSVI